MEDTINNENTLKKTVMEKSDSAICVYQMNENSNSRYRSNSNIENQFSQRSQKYFLLEILQNTFGSASSLNKCKDKLSTPGNTFNKCNRKTGSDNLSTLLSAFYAKFVVVLGIAFPVTDILSLKAPPSFYQGFYLYLYLVSVIFVVFIYISHLRTRFIFTSLQQYQQKQELNSSYRTEKDLKTLEAITTDEKPIVRYGSFYLRIGAVAFGIGSMVYSGLEFGQYFELKHDSRCENILIVLNPIARMLLTIVQMQFIFLNAKDLCLRNHKIISRFGLMHMIATNLCEWLYVLVEETKHEIIHIAHKKIDDIMNEQNQKNILSLNNNNINATNINSNNINTINNIENNNHYIIKRATSLEIVVECRRTNIMGNLVQDASSFLFPCTIEYSLICAVTLFEMWKSIRGLKLQNKLSSKIRKISTTSINGSQHFSIDCARAHRGMFGGILVIVLSIISLIIYFELSSTIIDPIQQNIGIFSILISETILFFISIIAILIAMYQIRDLRYSKLFFMKQSQLDCNLLIVAQSGIYIYTMFSIIGSYFSLDIDSNGIFGLITEILSLIQTSLQTLFILNAWWRRCHSSNEIRKKPGREIITFLLVTNMSLWSINSLIKNRAAFRPTHLQFFGQWAWTIITHISMPLAIFYRLHSTICLFEIWKTTYKVRKS